MKIKNLFQHLFLFACLTTSNQALSAAPVAIAHNFHTSLTRIDYNEKEKIYEITIQLFTHDLAPLLEKKTGKRVDLDKSDVDRFILDYLNKTFVLIDKKGEKRKLEWVGKEINTDTAWIYLETPAAEGLENYKLQNTIFFESFPEQTNLVICRYEGKKADLMFKAGDKVKEITSAK